MPATGTLALAAHPTPTPSAANVDCNAGTLTDPGDSSNGEGLVLQRSPLVERASGYQSRPDAVVVVGISGNVFMTKIGPCPRDSGKTDRILR
jgi:hypothetical protein